MDAAGWADVADVLRLARLSAELLDAAVRENNKSRLEVRDGRIRACQGHSLAGMPVTQEALAASWEEDLFAGLIWHGTSPEAAESIAGGGVLPGVDPEALRASGLRVYRSPNGVLLARRVPAACITALEVRSDRAARDEPALRALFGLAG